MKKLFASCVLLLSVVALSAQTINRITIDRNGALEHITIGIDDNNVMYLDKQGNMTKYGFDRFAARGGENYDNTLDPYMGRVEYYNQTDDAAFRGKIKSIGRYIITYYASFDNESLRGKIKSIGNMTFDYYASFENEAFRGNIKQLGQYAFTWYASSDNEAFRGRLKSVGSTTITYYSSFDDKLIAGKVKNLGGSSFTWYTSFDRRDYRGAMKTGTQMQTFAGVRFFVRG